jgi:hypothetical protein
MTVTVKISTPISGGRRRATRPERIVETWVFRLLLETNVGHLLLDSYSRGRAGAGRLKPKLHDKYSRSGSPGNMQLADVRLPDEVQEKARAKLVEQISVTKQI